MKKTLGNYCCEYFKMPRLDRRDLEKIERVIRAQLKPHEYHIALDGLEYDAVADIPSQEGLKFTLVIHTRRPVLRLKLAHSWAELYSEDLARSNPAIDGLSKVIAEKERKRMWRALRLAPVLAPSLGFGALALLAQLVFVGELPLAAYYPAFVMMACLAAWWILGYLYCFYRFSCIDLRR